MNKLIILLILFILAHYHVFAQNKITDTVFYENAEGKKRVHYIYILKLVDSSKMLPLISRHLTDTYAVTYYEPLETPYELKVADQFYFHDAYQTGRVISYYYNGNISEVINFYNGRINNNYKYYDSSGRILISGKFDKNAKTGVWKYYDSSGNLKSKGKYYPDVRIYKSLYYEGESGNAIYGKDNIFLEKYEDTSVSNTFSFRVYPRIEYYKDGKWKHWENKKLKKIEYWRRGKLIKIKDM